MNNVLNEDNLNEVFNLEEEKPVEVIKAEPPELPEKKEDSSSENSYQTLSKVKETQFEVIEKTKPLLDASIEISLMSQHPQTIAATASLISSITNASELIAKIELNTLKLKQGKGKDSAINIDKAVFIGSTAELQKELTKLIERR